MSTHTHSNLDSAARKRNAPDAGVARLDVTKLVVRLTNTPKPLPDLKNIPFGSTFSDHMAIASYDPVSGWSAPEIKPYGPLTLDPAASCLQYCSSVFEGMKAYLGHDGKIRLFRPDMNMLRLERSIARLALPPINGDTVLDLIKRLVQIERRWIPTLPDYSLYIRPTVIGTRTALNLVASETAILYILTTPYGPYFQRPVSLLALTDAVRAWPGGTGGHKFGGNYSPAFSPQREASAKGYDNVLWLFGEDRRVTEAGAMNVFVVLKRPGGDGWDVITPSLDGTILPGVTRDSCLVLAADPAFHATIFAGNDMALHSAERTFTMSDLQRWSADGTLLEVFSVGTAVIVAAVGRIGFEGRDIHLPLFASQPNALGPVGSALRAKLLAIQEGKEEYHGWSVACE